MVYNEVDELNAEQKLAKVMLDLRLLFPFYSAVYEYTEKIENNKIDTMGVSANKIFYNKEFVEKLHYDELLFVNLHELCHIALKHVLRRGNRQPQVWNIVNDLYVNALLNREIEYNSAYNKVKLPSSALFSQKVNIDNDSSEELYDMFIKQYEEQKDNKSEYLVFDIRGDKITVSKNYKYDLTEGIDECDADNQSELTEANIDRILREAAVRCKLYGNNSSSLEEVVNKLLKSRLDWKKVVRKHLVDIKSKDITFNKPDKRMYYQKAIYPGNEGIKKGLENIYIAIDTSGSISKEQLSTFYYQIKKLLDSYNVGATIIQFDTEIRKIDKLNKAFNADIDIHGRGGTVLEPLFEYLSKIKSLYKPKLLVIFTDGYFDYESLYKYKKQFNKNTVWIMMKDDYDSFELDFGTKTFINI